MTASMTKLQTLASFWQGFSLPNVQQKLDLVATDITSRQDDSDASRKQLIDMLRDFKKNQSEEVKLSAAPVVKKFQNEVDSLARRAKAGEKAFFDIYQSLADMPDPLPILEQAIERNHAQASKIQDYEIETKQLRETLAECNLQITDMKGKDKKLAELQAMITQYDKNIDDTLNQRLAEAMDKINADHEDRIHVVEEEKETVARKLLDAEQKLKETQRMLESAQTELYDVNNKVTEKADARSEEAEMLLNDLETANQRATLAEKQVEVLKERIAGFRTSPAADRTLDAASEVDHSLVSDLKRELACKERELGHVEAALASLKEDSQKERLEMTSTSETLAAHNESLNTELARIKQQLARQADYESIKKDLAILKSLEFSYNDGEDDAEEKPLEVMILERSKALQSENTVLRMDKERLANELTTATSELAEKAKEADSKSKLVAQLEEHVEKLQDLANINRGEAEGRSSTDFLAELDLGKSESPTTSMTSSLIHEVAQKGSSEAASILPIVQAQRERFRKRNVELEEEQSRQMQQLALVQSQVKDLQTDNVKLYEKIRFLQGYQSPAVVNRESDQVMIPVESRYKHQYEQRLDPFATFSHQEKQRKYSQLNIVEKIILSMVQFMLSNKVARLFVFTYSVLLHGLVFLVLMKMAYTDSFRRDQAASEWQQKYIQHMQAEHELEHHNPMI